MPEPFHPVVAPIEEAYPLCGVAAGTLEAWDRNVIVDVVHDGVRVPPSLDPLLAEGSLRPEVHDAFVRERDWGASAVAERLALHLGLRGYQSMQAARVTCDFNRFRGVSVPEAGHLGRRALFEPAARLLSAEQAASAMATIYDPVAEALFARMREALGDGPVRDSRAMRVTVHTYDDRAGPGERRPKTSLIFTPFEYHEASRIPAGVYPPVFPDRLAEFTADRTLAYRMALMLEKAYLPVAVNSPYFLPLGGVEMRLQVWCFVQHLRACVETLGEPALIAELDALWPCLEEVSTPWAGREHGPEVLSGLHELATFMAAHHGEAIERYRYSAYRPNTIEVEVRKDVIWDGAWKTLGDGREAFVPDEDGLQEDEVDRVASVMAAGIRKYLTEDQPAKRAGALRQ